MASVSSVPLPSIVMFEPEASKLSSLPLKSVVDKMHVGVHQHEKSYFMKPLDLREAISLLVEGRDVDPSYYSPVLCHCIERNSASETKRVHAHMIKTGILDDSFSRIALVNVYSKCGYMENARKVFDYLPSKSVTAWNSMVTGYVLDSKPVAAMKVFVEMLNSGISPTDFTCGTVLNACSSLKSVRLGKQMHGYIIKFCVDHYTSVGNALCSMYSKFGSLDSAIKAFSKITDKDVISWTTVVNVCGDNGESTKGILYFIEMLLNSSEPNNYTLASVLSLCCSMLMLDLGKQIHALSFKLGYGSNLPIMNSAMYLYLKCGYIEEAVSLFNRMEDCNLISYNTMIAGHAQAMELAKDDMFAYHCGIEALRLFTKLNRSSMKADLFTLSSILSVCTRLASLEQGEQIHAYTVKSGFLSDVVVGTSLVNMYNKCGSIKQASKAFLEIPIRTLITWTTMIASFAQNGLSHQALQLFEDMRLAGIKPNAVTFVSVLSACSHTGLVEEARNYFEMMQKVYRIKPVVDHYGCLVDMFVRLNKLDEAFEVVKTMEVEPNDFIWLLLISGARIQGNQELCLYAAEQLLNMKAKGTETYLRLLNVYVSAERWKDVSKLRKVMKEEKVRKLKDWSWVSIKDKVFSFKSNDQMHTNNVAACKMLENLLPIAKCFGYEPSENRATSMDDFDNDEVNEKSSYHSEKLAVAFTLLTVHGSAPIRVFKSRSMCKDCHNFMKSVSISQNRRIVIRDSMKLHIFENGLCSCADFCGLF